MNMVHVCVYVCVCVCVRACMYVCVMRGGEVTQQAKVGGWPVLVAGHSALEMPLS